VGFKYAGLICLLVALGAFFALWLHTISNRSKTVEGEKVPADNLAAPEQPMRQSGYSLSPEQKRQATDQLEPSNRAMRSGSVQSARAGVEHSLPISPTVEKRDETADNHIEMAQLFFNMGDFEGVIEMCQLVLDNPSASAQQIESALELKARC